MRRYDPCPTFRCFWSAALAAVQSTPVRAVYSGIFAGRAPACFSEAALARPLGPEPRPTARFNKLFEIHWF